MKLGSWNRIAAKNNLEEVVFTLTRMGCFIRNGAKSWRS